MTLLKEERHNEQEGTRRKRGSVTNAHKYKEKGYLYITFKHQNTSQKWRWWEDLMFLEFSVFSSYHQNFLSFQLYGNDFRKKLAFHLEYQYKSNHDILKTWKSVILKYVCKSNYKGVFTNL